MTRTILIQGLAYMEIWAFHKNLKYIETISRFFRLYSALRNKGD